MLLKETRKEFCAMIYGFKDEKRKLYKLWHSDHNLASSLG